jgi:hypothetical protein
MQPVRQRRRGDLGDPTQPGPSGGLLEALATRAAGQSEAQQVRGIGDPAQPLDGLVIAGNRISE